MSDQSKIFQLIVRQVPVAGSELDGLLRLLQAEFGLDLYTARQRLIGPGLALFGKGSLEKTGQIASVLRRHGFACWQIVPSAPTLIPSRLRSLQVSPNHVIFECQAGPVRMERGAQVLAVFADISGALADKQVKRLLAQNTYRGRDALTPLTQEEMIPTIFQGNPVFDFYLFDDQGQPRSAVRVLPGRFNPAGLGDKGSMSSRGNLEAILSLVKEYAGSFRLRCDFGLSQLPKCQVQRLEEGLVTVEDNLKSLNHYGWLLTQLRGDGGSGLGSPADDAADLLGGVVAASIIGQPALGAAMGSGGAVDLVPGLGEVAQELRQAVEADTKPAVEPTAQPVKKDLPPPPERPVTSMSPRTLLAMVGTFFGGLCFVLVTEGDSGLFRLLASYGVRAGVVPALVATGLLWSGFHFVRLKRRVENTPTSKIRSIAMGLVEVHGQALRQYALVAPMTQSACVYYRLRKYRRDHNNKWRLVKDVDSRHVAFQVDDGTGRVVVAPQGASVKAKTRQTGYPGQSALAFTSFDQSGENEKWVEEVIYEGTTLYVLGYAQPLRVERRSLRERTVEKLRELKLDRKALHRYDTDGDGRISEDEWQLARSDAEQAAMKDHLAEGTAPKRQAEHVVIARPPQRGMPFVIAEAASEAHLIRNYGLISIPLLLFGVLTAAFALYKLLEFFGF